jgi:hypothetical protein
MHFPLDGNATDAASGFVGSLIGNASFSGNVRAGCTGKSLYLDGSLDKVIVETGSLGISSPFTVSVWANAASRRPEATLAFLGSREEDTAFDLKYLADELIRADIGDGSQWLAIHDTPVTYGLNEWHHVAAVVNSSSYTLYYDGVAIDQQSLTGNALLLDADHGFTIGAVGPFLFPHGEDFHGWIDDVRVYSRALSPTEVAEDMECHACEPVLDQQHDFAATDEGTVRSDIDRAQTFTVGVTGTLSRVDLRVRRPDASTTAPLLLDIRSTSAGGPVEPNAPVLASVSIPASTIPIVSLASTPFTSFDLSAANLQVAAGDILAVVLRSANPYEWAISNSGGYSAGSEFVRSPVTSHQWDLGALDDDFAFRTFVLPECVDVTANADGYTVDEDRTLTINAVDGVLSNDIGPTGSTLTASLVEEPSNGTLELNANGSFTYAPDHDFVGIDTFTYTASDGRTVSNAATVTITISAVLDAVIDVKIGSEINSTNLSSNGMIAVAILTTAGFDATAVNASSVVLAGRPRRSGHSRMWTRMGTRTLSCTSALRTRT